MVKRGFITMELSEMLPQFDVIEEQGLCYLDSPNVATFDMRNTTSELHLHEFVCSENVAREVNGAFSLLNDAHAFAHYTNKMFTQWTNTPALKDQIKMRVHYGQNRASAFFGMGSLLLWGMEHKVNIHQPL